MRVTDGRTDVWMDGRTDGWSHFKRRVRDIIAPINVDFHQIFHRFVFISINFLYVRTNAHIVDYIEMLGASKKKFGTASIMKKRKKMERWFFFLRINIR